MKQNMNRWLSLLGALILAAALAACGSSPQQGGASNTGSSTIQVVAEDFKFSLASSQANAGTVTFIVTNDGNMPHDFAIRGSSVEEKTPMIQPGETKSLTVDLEPGSYAYECKIPGHAQLGMQGTFTVTPGSSS